MIQAALEYWPPVSHVAQWYNSDEVQLQLEGNYQKQSFLNRCKIAGVDGKLTLSVPLIGGREQKAVFKNVLIDNTQRWAIQHLRTLRSCYGKSPFFDYYFPAVEAILLQPVERLAILNQKIMNQSVIWLKWKGQMASSDRFLVQAKPTTDFLKPYVQVFADQQPFHPNLSILDLLFCTGPMAVEYLKQ